jgi:hypothetical protein
LVKLKSDTTRGSDRDKPFVQNGIKESWIWLITSIDEENLDYTIQPLYLDSECGGNMTQLGGELQVLYDEIETVELDRDGLFDILKRQECNC